MSSIYLYLGDSNNFNQIWNLDDQQRDDSFLIEGQNVTGYDLLNIYSLLPFDGWKGAGLVSVDGTPFIYHFGCPNNSSGIIIINNAILHLNLLTNYSSHSAKWM